MYYAVLVRQTTHEHHLRVRYVCCSMIFLLFSPLSTHIDGWCSTLVAHWAVAHAYSCIRRSSQISTHFKWLREMLCASKRCKSLSSQLLAVSSHHRQIFRSHWQHWCQSTYTHSETHSCVRQKTAQVHLREKRQTLLNRTPANVPRLHVRFSQKRANEYRE